MRRIALVALFLLAFAPAARASCGGSATPTVGSAALWAPRLTAATPRARCGGKVNLVVATSAGATGNTPLGEFHVYRKVVSGYDCVLYYPNYFLRGFSPVYVYQ